MLSLEILTVCKMNYESNCGNCPLRINNKCLSNEKTETMEQIQKQAEDYLKDKSVYIFQSKENQEAYYLTNGRINSNNKYKLLRLGQKEILMLDELILINEYTEIKLNFQKAV